MLVQEGYMGIADAYITLTINFLIALSGMLVIAVNCAAYTVGTSKNLENVGLQDRLLRGGWKGGWHVFQVLVSSGAMASVARIGVILLESPESLKVVKFPPSSGVETFLSTLDYSRICHSSAQNLSVWLPGGFCKVFWEDSLTH